MITQEKTNQCSKAGKCLVPRETERCVHERVSVCAGRCSYLSWLDEKCLSPFALTAAREAAAEAEAA